jgi:hypothetical protein
MNGKSYKFTHQAHKEEENLEPSTHASHTSYVPVANSGHGHHKKIDTVPVGQTLAVVEMRWITRVFQLQEELELVFGLV